MSSRRRLARPFLAALAAALGLALPARAEEPSGLRLETLVPGRTLAFASFDGVGTWGERWKATAIAKLAADPDMKAFAAPIGAFLEEALAGGEGKESPVPPIVADAFRQLQGLSGQVAFALVDVGEQGPVAVASLDFGSRLRDFVTFLERMKAEAGDALRSEERDGRPWFSAGPEGGAFAHATTLGTSVLVSTDRAWLDGVVASKAAPLPGALTSVDAYGKARVAVGDATAFFVFANAPALVERFAPKEGEVTRVLSAFGVDSIRGVSYAMAFHGDGFRESFVFETAPSDRGLGAFFSAAQPITRRGLAMAPASAFAFSESWFPFGRLLPVLRPMLAAVDPSTVEEVDGALAKAREATGVDLEKDVLPLLADDVSYYVAMPETGGLYPELAVSFGVRDAARFEEVVSKAVDGLLATVGADERVTGKQRVLEWHGKRLHVVELAGVRRDMVPFTPTWAVLGDRWVVTLVPHAMKELILRADAGGKGLADQEDVVALLRQAPEKATSFGYFDLQALLTLLYDTAVPVLQTLAKPNLLPAPFPLDWAALPPTRAVRPYFRSVGSHSYVKGDIAVSQIDSPFGLVAPMLVAGGAAAAFFTARRVEVGRPTGRAVPGPDSDPRPMVADIHARTIAEAVTAYRAGNGRLPTSLDQLLQEKNERTGRPWLDRLPKDPWGQAYEYLVRDASTGDFVVRSAGPDKTPGTLDDVAHPAAEER